MIRVNVERSLTDGRIRSFAVSGHANYAEYGRDIVCAAVSAITVGTVNAVEQLTGCEMPSRMHNGFLQAEVPQPADETQAAKMQLLLESMLVMLQTIEQSYGSYISIRETTK